MASPLRKLLDREGGWKAFQVIIPHPFLPPRFQKPARDRNMILLLDQDMTLHVRWEGSRLHEHRPLTPKAAARLIQEVLKYMSKYRKDMQVFSRFIMQSAEQPFKDKRPFDPVRLKNRDLPPANRADKDYEGNEAVDVGVEVEILEALEGERIEGLGGESPMPSIESNYE